jgi:hypothetical protein
MYDLYFVQSTCRSNFATSLLATILLTCDNIVDIYLVLLYTSISVSVDKKIGLIIIYDFFSSLLGPFCNHKYVNQYISILRIEIVKCSLAEV